MQSVVALNSAPRALAIESAVEYYRSGRFSACLDALRGLQTFDALLLRGRALLRLGTPAEALTAFEAASRAAARDERTDSHDARARVATLKGTALARLDRDEEAEAAFVDARAYAWSTNDPRLHSELEYYLALTAWSRRDLDSAGKHVNHALRLGDAEGRIRALELAAFISGAEGRYDVQARRLVEALDTIENSGGHEAILEASILSNLSILARELVLPGISDRIEQRLRAFSWTEELAKYQYTTTTQLGWCRALAGDEFGGYRFLRMAPTMASSVAWKAMSFSDMALLARFMGERGYADSDIAVAGQTASDIAWESIDDEARVALLSLARVTSAHDPERARVLMERYDSIKRRISSMYAFRSDRRMAAFEADARAAVALALGDTRRATLLFIDAFDVWKSIDYRARATETALELWKLTHEERFGKYAAFGAKTYPNSWLARAATELGLTAASPQASAAEPGGQVETIGDPRVADLSAYRRQRAAAPRNAVETTVS